MKNSALSRRRSRTRYLTHAAFIASLYVALTYLSSLVGLASGPLQVRLSEMLTVLVAFTPAAIPGLTVGCFISNILVGGVPIDIIFGTLATLLGALGGYYLARLNKYLAPIPAVISNTLIIPLVLRYIYAEEALLPLLMLGVGVGELISAAILGSILTATINERTKNKQGKTF